MKRRVLIGLFVLILVCAAVWIGFSINDLLIHQRAQALAQQVADALGRTPANEIVEFRNCGMVVCGYDVYFTSSEEFAGTDARAHALTKLNLSVGYGTPSDSANPLLNSLNGDLDRTPIHGRLTVTSTSTYREPVYSYWVLQNERGETICRIYLYRTKDTGVTYLFDGKPLPNTNIAQVETLVNPTK